MFPHKHRNSLTFLLGKIFQNNKFEALKIIITDLIFYERNILDDSAKWINKIENRLPFDQQVAVQQR